MLYVWGDNDSDVAPKASGPADFGGAGLLAQKRPGRDEFTRRMVPIGESGDATASAVSSLLVSLRGSQRDTLSSSSSTLFPLGYSLELPCRENRRWWRRTGSSSSASSEGKDGSVTVAGEPSK